MLAPTPTHPGKKRKPPSVWCVCVWSSPPSPLQDTQRRSSAKAVLGQIGIQEVQVPHGISGSDLIMGVVKAGRYCKVSFNEQGKAVTGLKHLVVRCADSLRAAGVLGCSLSHAQAMIKALQMTTFGPYYAVFEDDLVLKAPGREVNDIVTILMAKAAGAGFEIKILWIGGKDMWGSMKKGRPAEHNVLSTTERGGSTWQLIKVRDMCLSHAYIIHETMLRHHRELCTGGWASDNSLSQLAKAHLCAAIFKDGVQYSLIGQWSVGSAGGSCITKPRHNKASSSSSRMSL